MGFRESLVLSRPIWFGKWEHILLRLTIPLTTTIQNGMDRIAVQM
jgi:hypothetical protein